MNDIINIASILLMGSGLVIGYFSSIRKSLARMMLLLVLFLFGFILIPLISRVFLSVTLPEFVQFSVGKLRIRSIPQVFSDLSDMYFRTEMTESPIYLTLEKEAMRIVAQAFSYLFWILIAMPLLYFGIRFVSKKVLRRFPASDGSARMGIRMAAGLLSVLLPMFFFSVPLSGVMEMAQIINEPDSTEMDDYRKTIPGFLFGFFHTNGKPLDAAVFDCYFSFSYQDHRISLRTEPVRMKAVYVKLLEAGDEISPEMIFGLEEKELRDLFENISCLESLDLLIPLGMEYAISMGYLDQYLDHLISPEILRNAIPDIMDVDFHKDLPYFPDIILSFRKSGLLQIKNPEDLLSLDITEIDILLKNLSKIEVLGIIGDCFTEFMGTSEVIRKYHEIYRIQPVRLSDISWREEVIRIRDLYQIFRILYDKGIAGIDERDLIRFTDTLFRSQIFLKNTDNISDFIWEMIPESYRSRLSKAGFGYQDYLSALNLGKLIYQYYQNGTWKWQQLFSEENMEIISRYVSASVFFSNNLPTVFSFVTESLIPEPFPLVYPDNLVWNSDAGKRELKAILVNMKKIFEIAEGTGEEMIAGLDSLSYTLFQSELLTANLNSALNYAVGLLGYDITLDFQGIDWRSSSGKNEFRKLVKAFVAVYQVGISEEFLSDLTDGTADTNGDGIVDGKDGNAIKDISETFSDSRLIRQNLSVIIHKLWENTEMELSLVLPENPDDWTKTEIEAVLKTAKIAYQYRNDFFQLLKLSDRLDSVFASKIVTDTITGILYDSPDFNILGISCPLIINIPRGSGELRDHDRQIGEIHKLYHSFCLIFKSAQNFSDLRPEDLYLLTDGSADTNGDGIIDDTDSDEITEILESRIIADTLISLIADYNQQTIAIDQNILLQPVIRYQKYDVQWYGKNGELRKLITAFKTVFPDGSVFSDDNFDLNIFKNISTGTEDPADDDLSVILESVVIRDTVIGFLKSLNRKRLFETTLIVNVRDSDWLDSEKGEPGELRRLIRGINIILRNVDLNHTVFSKDIILGLTDGSTDTNGDGVVDQNDSNDLQNISQSRIISDCVIQMFYEMMKEKYGTSSN